MKPLILLLLVFALSAFSIRLRTQQNDWAQSGRIAMFAMLCFTTLGHFLYSNGMSLMIPDFIPFKIALVYITGFMELALGVALLFPATRIYAGWGLIIFFLILLPANIHAAVTGLDYQTGALDGPGLSYLWFRIPLQFFFIIWIYSFAIRSW